MSRHSAHTWDGIWATERNKRIVASAIRDRLPFVILSEKYQVPVQTVKKLLHKHKIRVMRMSEWSP